VSSANSNGAQFVGALFQVVFALTFPLMLITLCGLSFVLAVGFHLPQFGFWGGLASIAIEYARTNTWAGVALGLFALAALPLAWVAFREHEVRASGTIGSWVCAIIVGGITVWLAKLWSYDGTGWQSLFFALFLFSSWASVVEAVLSSAKIIAFHRANRPKPVTPPKQQPHGSEERRRPRDEPETI
jgi:hypothetical protein